MPDNVINKVVFDGRTLIDLTGTTATADKILTGYGAYGADGVWMDGTASGSANVWQDQDGYIVLPPDGDGGGGGGSGGIVEKKQINFIDYDGTLVASRTKEEINAMTSNSDLPSNPSHTGLVAQGWNWTVAQLKAQLLAQPNDTIWVGQMYITQSGDTEIDVSMPDGRLSPILNIAVDGTVTVDWGDNTTADTVTGTSLAIRESVPHTYANAGNYTIIIHAVSGSFSFYGGNSYTLLRKNTTANENKVYANCVQAVRLGGGITSLATYAFHTCASLASITIPSGITSIGQYAFHNCYSLASITIPSDVTSIESYALYLCYALASISIPSGVTSIGNNAFYNCYSLASITIPSGVTSIGTYAIYGCASLASITIPSGVTSISNYMFYNCYSLASITIPSRVTSIGNGAFSSCYSLASVTIPSGVTSIGSNAFYYCYSLASITIPSDVTSIGDKVFYQCYGMKEYHILPTTIPTGGTTMFYSIVSDCTIYVPKAKLSDYQTSTNWSEYASYMVGE